MRLKRDLDDRAITGIIRTIGILVIVVMLVVFVGMWIAIGGNPMSTHKFVDSEVKVGLDFSSEGVIRDIGHSTTVRKGYESFEMSDFAWWDPVSAEVEVQVRLFVDGQYINSDSAGADITALDQYSKTFHLTTGPLPDDASSYTLEIDVMTEGTTTDTASVSGSV